MGRLCAGPGEAGSVGFPSRGAGLGGPPPYTHFPSGSRSLFFSRQDLKPFPLFWLWFEPCMLPRAPRLPSSSARRCLPQSEPGTPPRSRSFRSGLRRDAPRPLALQASPSTDLCPRKVRSKRRPSLPAFCVCSFAAPRGGTGGGESCREGG